MNDNDVFMYGRPRRRRRRAGDLGSCKWGGGRATVPAGAGAVHLAWTARSAQGGDSACAEPPNVDLRRRAGGSIRRRKGLTESPRTVSLPSIKNPCAATTFSGGRCTDCSGIQRPEVRCGTTSNQDPAGIDVAPRRRTLDQSAQAGKYTSHSLYRRSGLSRLSNSGPMGCGGRRARPDPRPAAREDFRHPPARDHRISPIARRILRVAPNPIKGWIIIATRAWRVQAKSGRLPDADLPCPRRASSGRVGSTSSPLPWRCCCGTSSPSRLRPLAAAGPVAMKELSELLQAPKVSTPGAHARRFDEWLNASARPSTGYRIRHSRARRGPARAARRPGSRSSR